MKTFKFQMMLIIATIFGSVKISNAQQTTGLYLTFADHLGHKLSYAGDKIALHQFMAADNITVISKGQKLTLAKAQVYGYRDSNGNDFRFCDNKAYQVIDTTGFYIYSYTKLVQQGKGPRPTKVYYFSKKTDGAILALTPENIAIAFPGNPKFRNMVEVAVRSEIQLDAYDAQLNEYKIKEFYAESLR